MRTTDRDFLERVAIGPSFLMLGQATWALQDSIDPLLNSIAGLRDDSGGLVHPATASREFEASLRTLNSLSNGVGLPPLMETVASAAWNGVYTTLIDARVTRLFDNDWRRVAAIVGTEDGVSSPRSPTELKVRLLFGGVQLPEEQQPPRDALAFAVAEERSTSALRHLAEELITPRGVLAIEGYRPVSDWLKPERLYGFLSRLEPGQAHLFSANDDTLANPFLAAAVERGLLTAHESSLAALLSSSPTPALSGKHSPDRTARHIRIAGELVELPRDLWNSTISTARPVDEQAVHPLLKASASLRYKQFRAFMGASSGSPDWASIASGFSFDRGFQHQLWGQIQSDLVESDSAEPLVLEGQTASGKSTALAITAIQAARQGQVPTLFVPTQSTRPQLTAIDRFAKWASDNGSSATILLWDGMTDPDVYFEAHRTLRSRGRRVVIVGTSYLSQRYERPRRVTAPSTLTAPEAARLGPWLATYGIELTPADTKFIAKHPSFLAALYRLLPESRRKVRDGLNLELRSAEADMERLARRNQARADSQTIEMTTMASALAAAGVDLPAFIPRDGAQSVREVDFSSRSTAEQLSAIVMVAGRRNIRVPLALTLRTLGRDGAQDVVDVVKDFDIIRWSDDESGDQFLGARNALEAELLSQSDLGDARAEVEVICSLLRHVRPRPGAGGAEVDFAADLLARVGPNSPEESRFVAHFLTVADALAEIRASNGQTHDRLVLSEANFIRKWVIWSQKSEEVGDGEVRAKRLAEASKLLEDALSGSRHPPMRLKLLVESASVLGAEAVELSKSGVSDGLLRELATRIVERTTEARSLDPENYYPIDVVAWVAHRLVGEGFVTGRGSVDLAANAFASMVSLEKSQLSTGQQAKYDMRMIQLAELMGNEDLKTSQLALLAENQDPAAYFLLALMDSGLMAGDTDPEGASRSFQRIRSASTEIRADWRCSRLMLDLFWLAKAGRRFLQGEREALPFSSSDWEECLSVADAAIGVAEHDRHRVEFLRGMALFHLGQLNQSKHIFDQLDRETGSIARRIVTTYLASDPMGTPRQFTGQVRNVRPDGSRGFVWVDELGAEVPFVPRRFNIDDLQRNSLLPAFWIGFNMRGPYADPIRSMANRSEG